MLDWCSHKAAAYAVDNWHYSERMPLGKLVKVGVWENDQFVGAVIYGRGANANIGKSYDLNQTEICELVRVALKSHETEVSRIIAISLKLLKKQYRTLQLIISYADPAQDHVGTIYQAGGWIYSGTTNAAVQYFAGGRWKHRREVTGGAFGGCAVPNYQELPQRVRPPKHRYLMPLTKQMRQQVAPLAQAYPKNNSR